MDYKIASKAIASRIESVLPLIINQDQTGFLKERFIGQNIRLIVDIFEQTKLKEIPGILLLLDFKKAFDSIESSFIQKTLDLFDFGNDIKQWILTQKVQHYTMDIRLTGYFKLSRGVRQGCPLSPYLFILGAEILAARIRQGEKIEGIELFGTEHKISQFADDTSTFLKNIASVQSTIETIGQFGDISGLRLNTKKTKAILLGPWRFNRKKTFGTKLVK